MTRVATFGELVSTATLEIGDGYRAKNQELGGDGLIFLRAAYLQDDGFTMVQPDRFLTNAITKFGPKIAQVGDVAITTKGNSTGRVGRIREPQAGSVYSPHLSYWRSKRRDELDQSFLFYWSQSPEFRSQLAGMASSTDMAPYLSLRDQLRLRISVPQIEDQRAIASILTALDDKIDLNQRMNETLEAMARTIFKDWFVDFGPTRAEMEGRAPYLAPEIWALFPDRLNGESKPDGWKTGKLDQIIAFSPSEPMRRGDLAPYLDMAALPTRGSTSDTPIPREYSSGTRFRNGDTLLARITPCLENGKTAFVQNLPTEAVGWGSTEFIVMRSISPVPMAVSYLLAREPAFRRHAIQSMTGTSGRQRASADAISAYPVTLPSDNKIWVAVGPLLEPVFAKIAANADESQVLAQTRDYLLPKLMSGEIQLREAERTVRAVA
jgi:type I restriction enzyme S subunit